MKIFVCSNCGGPVYFDSTVCVICDAAQGFDADTLEMRALDTAHDGPATAMGASHLRLCRNAGRQACNWLVETEGQAGEQGLCRACRHNATIPDLSLETNLIRWRRIEEAKRHLFYSLLRWRLPAPTRADDPAGGLAFEFLADAIRPDGTVEPVMTGHMSGTITISIAEGDDAERERRRLAMNEPYRTLLGHFRHEIGHYYWDMLVRDGARLEAFRDVFGDERADYQAALQRHHGDGAPEDWPSRHISAYAAAHPWEDFAESFAHFLHMVDTLETAQAFGLQARAGASAPDYYAVADAGTLMAAWVPLTLAVNAINRSMGQPDLYPFVVSPVVAGKLQFIADLVVRQSQSAAESPDQ